MTIVEEIGRIEAFKSKGLLTDSLYNELIGPLEIKLAMLESGATRGVDLGEIGASAPPFFEPRT